MAPPAPQLSFPSHPAGRWELGERAHLSFLQASGDLHHSNQRYPFQITPTETTTSLFPGTSPSKRKPRLLGSAGSPLMLHSRPTPRSTQEPISNSGAWSKLPIQGPDPRPPPSGSYSQGPRAGTKAWGGLTHPRSGQPGAEAQRSAGSSRRRAARAQRSKRCWLPTRRHWEQKRRVRVGAGVRGPAKARASGRAPQSPALRVPVQTADSRTHARWFACHLHSALGMDLRSFGHAHLPSSRGREPSRSGTGRGTWVHSPSLAPPNSSAHRPSVCFPMISPGRPLDTQKTTHWENSVDLKLIVFFFDVATKNNNEPDRFPNECKFGFRLKCP